MKSIDPADLSEHENYKFLTGSIIPRPVAFVTTQSSEGVLNAAPFSYFNIVTQDPPMISLSIQRLDGKMKDTARNAIETRAFVVHLSDETYIDKINQTAKALPPDESELDDTGLTPIKSTKISVPGVAEASVRMECVLEKILSLGGKEDHPACDLLIGRVVFYHIRDDLYKNGRIDPLGLRPVSRMAGNAYAKLGETFELKRPK